MTRQLLGRRAFVGAMAALMMAASSSGAGEIGAFLTLATPTKDWGTGFGVHAALISLPFLQAGGEFARIKGEDPLVSIETYTAQVEVNPPALKISPFVGLGIGAYRQKFGAVSDWGSLNAIFGGVRVPIGAARLRAEFRKISLSGTPRVNVDKRFSLGVSFRF
ncbi:MAG: hypothetical protein JJE39_01345 [Vicinamibacteria bacterium]|nr:hypothetical protein [Vicinamibacteria bacterium]